MPLDLNERRKQEAQRLWQRIAEGPDFYKCRLSPAALFFAWTREGTGDAAKLGETK
jgi:hypothetical protein